MKNDRRGFLKKGLYATLGLLGIGFLVPAAVLFAPLSDRSRGLVYFPLLPEDEVPRRGVRKSELLYRAAGKERRARVFLVAAGKELVVLSATCSHLGCLVNYNKEKGEFECPCHGGRYDLAGRNVAGPPPAPLNRLPVRIEQGMLMVGIKVQAA